VPAVSAVAEAVVRSVLPETANVPCESNDEVAIIVPPVILLMVADSAESIFEKKFVDVADANEKLVAKKLVAVAFCSVAFVAPRFVLVLFDPERLVVERLVAVAFCSVPFVAPRLVAVALVSAVAPDTVNAVAEALVRVV
jgi:hypothetical protein